ncbi:MAG: DM13 domain-containing protein [Actinomycetota bacterium]
MAEILTSDAPRATPLRRAFSALGVVAVAAGVVIGGNPFEVRDRLFGSALPEPRPAAGSRIAGRGNEAPGKTVLRSQPWWQRVTTASGEGDGTTEPFTVDGAAIQWRVRWTCERGHLVVAAAGADDPLVDAPCPGSGTGYVTQTGGSRLEIAADGPWTVRVDQQVDVPLREPPLAAMRAPGATPVASGDLYRIERAATGAVHLYRLADGRYALRLADFYVSPNVDLEIRLSPLRAPQTTRAFLDAPSEWVAPLDITAGALNFVLEDDVDPTRYRSVVIWCPPLSIAYAGATLGEPR